MEHNIEQLLQSKILAEERKQMVWRKDATWARIQTDINTKKSASIYYAYAVAACVSLLIVFFGYRRYQSIIMSERLDSLAVCIEALKTENDSPRKSINPVPEVCETEPASTPPKAQITRSSITILRKKEPVSHDEIQSQTPVVEPFMMTVATSEPDHISTPVEEPVSQKVRPVIGVIMENPKEPVLVVRKKKSKIKFFSRDQDAPMLDVPEATTLTARIN